MEANFSSFKTRKELNGVVKIIAGGVEHSTVFESNNVNTCTSHRLLIAVLRRPT